MDVEGVLQDCVVEVATERYAIVRGGQPHSAAFARIDDGRERTQVVVESAFEGAEDALEGAEGALEGADFEACSRGWARLTFDIVLPFELVGFLARVAGALADSDVSVFALSAYSTDHVFVRETQLETASETLSSLGCVLTHDDPQ